VSLASAPQPTFPRDTQCSPPKHIQSRPLTLFLSVYELFRLDVRKISALTARNTNSDVRVAIKTLYYSAVEPGLSVEQNFERARKDLFLDVIKDLNEKNLFILKAAVEQGERHVKKVYAGYRRLSVKCHEEPFSYVYFYTNLAYLQSLGLILLISTKVNRSYTNRIELLFDPELLEAVWEMRFG
jgi:Cdc6-like AAA superfamily ATPase